MLFFFKSASKNNPSSESTVTGRCTHDGVLQLMKLNEEWDQVYHNATMRLQHRMEALELENTAIKQLNSRLLLKVEHQQVSTQQKLQNQHTGKYKSTQTDDGWNIYRVCADS